MKTKSTRDERVSLFSSEQKVSLFQSEERVSLFAKEDKVDITWPVIQGYLSKAFNTFSGPIRFLANIIHIAASRAKAGTDSSPSKPPVQKA